MHLPSEPFDEPTHKPSEADSQGDPRSDDSASAGAGGQLGHAAPSALQTFRLDIFRYDESRPDPPRFQSYEVAISPRSSLLEALLQIHDDQDPSLAFRYSCRGLVCGSCGVVLNGWPTLACQARLAELPAGRGVVEPLPAFAIIKDLVVDLEPFWEKYAQVQPWLHAETSEAKGARMSEQQRDRVDALANCILCALCYSSCPVVGLRQDFVGPAALAKLYRFLADSRKRRSLQTPDGANSEAGVWGCRTSTRCIEVCPKNVRPFDGIAGIRRKLLGGVLASLLRGRGHGKE